MKLVDRFLRTAAFRQQLSIAVTAGVLCVALLSSLASSVQGSRQIRDMLRSQGEQVADNLASQSKLALLYASSDNADVAVASALAFPDVTQVEIRRPDGHPLLVRAKGKNPPAPGAGAETPPSALEHARVESETDDAWRITAPVYGKEADASPFAVEDSVPERIGYVRIVQSKATLKRLRTEVFAINLGSAFFAAILFLLLIRLLTGKLMRPLSSLAEQMARAEQGESGVRATTRGPHDIAEMAKAFNSMIAVLEQREQELIQARDDAVKFARLKAEFAATVSHEIRTPLNGVIGTLDILMATQLPAKQKHFVELSWDSAQYLLTLVNNILDFSRLEAGRLELEDTDFSATHLIEDVIEMLASQAHQKGLELSYLASKDVPAHLRGDPSRIRQVLTNLVGNAIKFTETGDVVVRAKVIEHDHEQYLVRFEVIDSGIGISEDAQSRIFDSFAQADPSTTRRFGGSGLGLAICKQLAELMGGEIGVESEPGHGSTFWFTVPLGHSQAMASTPAIQAGWQGRQVLLVDESPAVRHFLDQALSTWGFRCLAAQSADEAYEALTHSAENGHPLEIVILDTWFASDEGGKLIARSRANPALAASHFIVMNHYGADIPPEGADALLSKPLRLERLLESIAEIDQADRGHIDVEEPAQAARCRVLIAEDNRTNQAIAESMLAMLGCQIEIAGDGHEALRAFKRQPFDIVLMDCNMPHMDGYQATAAIRALEAEAGHADGARRIPIIAMTANVQPADIEKCLAAGMDDHLPKPLTIGALGAKIERWAELPAELATPPASAPTAEPETDEPLDTAAFGKLRDALGDSLGIVVQHYFEDMPAYLETMEQALAARETERLRQAAHAVKGASGNFGAGIVARLSREIEMLAGRGETTNVQEILSQLHAEFALVKQALLVAIQTTDAPAVEPTGEGGLVLVVDDDRATRTALCRALERSGFKVAEAGDGAQALAMLDRLHPDVILMDALMPVLDGFSTCEQLQEMPQGRDIPVLMITALDDNASIERAFAVGASDYITKPIHLAVVQQRVGRIIDATRTARHVRHLAYHDTVTDLPNRAQFNEQLKHAIVQAEAHDKALALLFLDLDRFKFVNDTLGHEIGDRLLKFVGQRIRHCVRGGDTVARLGGDEFTVLLDDLPDPSAAANAAQKIERALATPFEIDGHDIFISTSIGISLYPVDGNNASTLLRHADTAMYRAKRANGGFRFYEAGMDATVSEHLRLESALRRALERDELIVYYQPEAETISGHLVGMEALIRWKHPTRGMVSPAEFIPLAEETGLIVPIGEWVLRTACQQAVAWLGAGIPRLQMAVNLSSVQLRQVNFIDTVARILRETCLPPHCLTLEITESVLMEHANETVSTLHQLKDLGVKLAIDDFGTGYSSLSYLKRFPVDILKIDYSFTRDIMTVPDDAAIVSGIVALAHSLRLEVVAEGVETPEQRNFLSEIGCSFIQGYYLSEPIPPQAYEQRILSPRYPAAHFSAVS